MKNCEENDSYLASTDCIDYNHPLVQEKVIELKEKAESALDYIKRAYEFVRDEIPHSWDIRSEVVSRTASDVLRNKTGICWTKSCLLAALLRANAIPSGISYQLLTRADEGDSEGYMIHALNTVYIEEMDRWIRLDARGNKDNIQAQFSLDTEKLAFPVRSELGEIDYKDNNPDLDARLKRILSNSRNILEITTSFEMQATGRKLQSSCPSGEIRKQYRESARLGMKECITTYAKVNTASANVLHKLGFKDIKEIPYECSNGEIITDGIMCCYQENVTEERTIKMNAKYEKKPKMTFIAR